MNKQDDGERDASDLVERRKRQDRVLLPILVAGIFTAIIAFTWAAINPRKQPAGSITVVEMTSFVGGLVLFIVFLIRASQVQPLDASTGTAAAEWTEDFQSYNTSLGLRLLATERQLAILRAAFDLGEYCNTTVTPPVINPARRQALIDLIESSETQAAEKIPLLFTSIPYSERYLLTGILSAIRQAGGPTAAARIDSRIKPDSRSAGDSEVDLKFEELRYSPHQCRKALSALSILHSDQDSLLRASAETSSSQSKSLLRPAESSVHNASGELLRSSDNDNIERNRA